MDTVDVFDFTIFWICYKYSNRFVFRLFKLYCPFSNSFTRSDIGVYLDKIICHIRDNLAIIIIFLETPFSIDNTGFWDFNIRILNKSSIIFTSKFEIT